MAHLEKYADLVLNIKNNEWLENCLSTSRKMSDLTNLIKTSRLNQMLDRDRMLDGLVNLAFMLINAYGVETNEFVREPKNVGQTLTKLAAEIFQDLFLVINIECSKSGQILF